MDKDKETQEWTVDSFVEAVMLATYGSDQPKDEDEDEDEPARLRVEYSLAEELWLM